MDIKSDEMASAIFGGFAKEDFLGNFLSMIKGKILDLERFHKETGRRILKGLESGWNFLKQWMKDDPIGASAGILAVGLLLLVGGVLIAAAIGGIKAFMAAGIVGKLWMIFKGLTLGIILSKSLQWGVRGAAFVWNFNWQITDDNLKDIQEGLITSLFGQLGATAGSAVGMVCGVGAVEISKRLKSIKVNPEIMARLDEISKGLYWGEDPPELADELIENVKALLVLVRNSAVQFAFIESYKNARKWVKNTAEFAKLEQIFPRLGDLIANWGNEDNEAWSFAFALETWIETLPSQRLRLFTEEFFDSLMDSCSETLMIVSHALG